MNSLFKKKYTNSLYRKPESRNKLIKYNDDYETPIIPFDKEKRLLRLVGRLGKEEKKREEIKKEIMELREPDKNEPLFIEKKALLNKKKEELENDMKNVQQNIDNILNVRSELFNNSFKERVKILENTVDRIDKELSVLYDYKELYDKNSDDYYSISRDITGLTNMKEKYVKSLVLSKKLMNNEEMDKNEVEYLFYDIVKSSELKNFNNVEFDWDNFSEILNVLNNYEDAFLYLLASEYMRLEKEFSGENPLEREITSLLGYEPERVEIYEEVKKLENIQGTTREENQKVFREVLNIKEPKKDMLVIHSSARFFMQKFTTSLSTGNEELIEKNKRVFRRLYGLDFKDYRDKIYNTKIIESDADYYMYLEENELKELKKMLNQIEEKYYDFTSGQKAKTYIEENYGLPYVIVSYLNDDDRIVSIDKRPAIYANKIEGGNIFNNIADAFSHIGKQEMPRAVRDFLDQYGHYKLSLVNVGRSPIKSYVDSLMNIVSLGQFEQNKKNINVDDMFHLWMNATLRDPNTDENLYGLGEIIIEKNDTVNISTAPVDYGQAEFMDVRTPTVTLREFINNGINELRNRGLEPFNYNGQNNNCQVFIDSILTGNGLNTPELKRFILQDTDYIVGTLSNATKGIMDGAINSAQFLNILIKGAGKHKKKGKRIVKGKSKNTMVSDRFINELYNKYKK